MYIWNKNVKNQQWSVTSVIYSGLWNTQAYFKPQLFQCVLHFILYIHYQRLKSSWALTTDSTHTLGLGLGLQSCDLHTWVLVLVLNVIFLALVLKPSVLIRQLAHTAAVNNWRTTVSVPCYVSNKTHYEDDNEHKDDNGTHETDHPTIVTLSLY